MILHSREALFSQHHMLVFEFRTNKWTANIPKIQFVLLLYSPDLLFYKGTFVFSSSNGRCISSLMLAKVTNNVVQFVSMAKCTNGLKFYQLNRYWNLLQKGFQLNNSGIYLLWFLNYVVAEVRTFGSQGFCAWLIQFFN